MSLSPSTTHIGDISITSVTDGTVSFAATTMFPTTTEADWVNHAQFVDNEGNLNLDV